MTDTHTYVPFTKAHGLLNDFVILDLRTGGPALSTDQVRTLADRRAGVGCDQLIVLSHSVSADCFMAIYNADGSEVGACGNATRVVGQMMLDETHGSESVIETRAGLLRAERRDNEIRVNMGYPKLEWQQIPLARAMDTVDVDYTNGPLHRPVAVNMGNPHAVFFVDQSDAVDLETLGPVVETDPLFPERVNVSVASMSPDGIRLRVWERGAGITPACGTAACAALVAAHRRGLSGRRADIHLDGGRLHIEWTDDGEILMQGPVSVVFKGEIQL